MRNFFLSFMAAAIIAFYLAVPAFADEDKIGGRMKSIAEAKEPVSIQADNLRYDRKINTYFAEGNVKITQKEYTLTSDKATLNDETGDAEARGNARLVSPDNVVFADVIKVNFNTKLGVIEQGNIFVKKGNYRIRGNPLEKVGDQEYLITGARFTTCNAEVPFWSVKAKSLDVRMDKDVVAKGAIFYIRDIPVLYMPYVWLPMLKPRTSGFMIPGGGYNTRDGARLIESYYWAPVGNFDSTLTLDYRGLRGLGVADEIRYAMNKDTQLRLYGYYMSDRKIDADRYNLSLKYQELFTPDISGRADINLSDKQFFRDLSDTARERTQRALDSNVWVTNRWDWGRGYLFGQYTEGLDPTQNNKAIVQRLPEAGFNVVKKEVLDQPLYFSLDSAATNFYKIKGVSGGRFDAFPRFSYDFNIAGLNIEPKVGYKETVYSLDDNVITETKVNKITNKTRIIDIGKFDTERGFFGMGIKAETNLYKIFHFSGGPFEGIRHTLIPEFAYNYVVRRGGENFPVFDGVDTYNRRNMITYSVTNRFVLKYRGGSPEPRVDYLSVKFSQFYDFYSDAFIGTRRRNFSSLYSEISYRSSLRLTLNNDFRYDFYQGNIRSVDTDLRYDSKDKTWHVGIGQRYSLDAEQTFLSPSRFDFFTPSTDFVSEFLVNKAQEESTVDFLTVEGGVKIGSHWELSTKVWYDWHTRNFRETDGTVVYSSQCWGLTFDYFNGPTRKQYMVMLNLKGIGNVKF